MGINELVKNGSTAVETISDQNTIFSEVPVVKYSLVDYSKYAFEYKINDDIDVNMFESDRTFDSDEFVDAEFDDAVSEKDYSYYVVAVASGVVTGLFSQLKLSAEALKKINDWKNKDWEKYITIAARMAGYKKTDYKGAADFIKNRFVPFVEENLNIEVQAGIEEWLNVLSNHPSVAGFVFSIFTQFSGNRYKLGDKGIIAEKAPDYYAIGRNTMEKLTYGFLYWVFNLAVDAAISKRALIDDLNLPKEVLKLLKELYKLPVFKNIPKNFEEAEKLYSSWLIKLFENSRFTDENGQERTFNLEEEIANLESVGTVIFEKSVPIIINECLVRGFYVVKKLAIEIKEKEIKSFEELEKVDVGNIIPFNNRLISRMVLISSGCFVGINVAGATLKAVLNKDKKNGKFAETLFAEVDIAGVGRFIFACVADSKYWSDDIKVFFQRKANNKSNINETEAEEKIVEDMMSNDSFNVLSLTPAQTRALYSLESIAITKDIEHTDKEDIKEKKMLWLETWQQNILAGMEIDAGDYFVTDEKGIYDAIYSLPDTEENRRWFYLLTSELVVFKPYYPLGSKNDGDFKKLQRGKYNYIDDQFVRRQTIVNQAEINAIREAYKKYKDVISGSTQSKIIAAGVATITAVATGGLAFAFAPGIATLIAGEAVVGLHGAALTSASLAFVGGGSLAAGGLGMAGGTAIITGGGALLGIAGSGSASMAAILSQTKSEYWLRQTAKLLVFSKCALKDVFSDVDAIKKLSYEISLTIKKVEANIKELEDEKCSLDKDTIKNSKECLKYLGKCKAELDKLD